MRTFRYILLLIALLPLTSALAQKMPERGMVRKGNRLYNKQAYTESIEQYQEALKQKPQMFEATFDLGNAFYKNEQYDHAEKQLLAAAADSLQTNENRAEAFFNLGNAQFKQNKYQEALESYKNSLRLNPKDMEAKYNYAYTKRLLDDNQNNQNQDQQNKDQNQDQNKDQQQNQQNQQGQNDQNQQDQNKQDQNNDSPNDKGQGKDEQDAQGDQNKDSNGQENPEQNKDSDAQPIAEQGISKQEQEQMLDAIQAQEDKTQEKLKEKKGKVIRRVRKNW